jgi:hypothetical protein
MTQHYVRVIALDLPQVFEVKNHYPIKTLIVLF